jgi:hypothetical protein
LIVYSGSGTIDTISKTFTLVVGFAVQLKYCVRKLRWA